MTGDITLRDLQPVIFENINSMIEDLDQAHTTKAFAAQVIDDQTSLNALTNRNRDRPRNRPLSFRPKAPNTNRPFRNQPLRHPTPKTQITDKFCRICNLAGSDPRIYTSHEIGTCSRLTVRDMESLRNALVLNGMVTLPQEDDCPAEPDYVLQPGWDDDEALQYQQTGDSE